MHCRAVRLVRRRLVRCRLFAAVEVVVIVVCSVFIVFNILLDITDNGRLNGAGGGDQKMMSAPAAHGNLLSGLGRKGLSNERNQRASGTHVVNYELNITKYAGMEVLLFNRVPKVGSTTLIRIVQHLGKRNNYATGGFYNPSGVNREHKLRLTHDQEKEAALGVFYTERPHAFWPHIWYMNFTKFNLPMPIYFNMVREPVERAISLYYHVRYQVKRSRHQPDLATFPLSFVHLQNLPDFSQCVLSGDRRCQYVSDYSQRPGGDYECMSCFFCGMDSDCASFNSPHVVQKAKANLERNYAVVGVLEHMDMTLSVLEAYIPRFFAGARETYDKTMGRSKANTNPARLLVSADIKSMLRKNFTHEIEFYEFCKQRLYRQYQALLQV